MVKDFPSQALSVLLPDKKNSIRQRLNKKHTIEYLRLAVLLPDGGSCGTSLGRLLFIEEKKEEKENCCGTGGTGIEGSGGPKNSIRQCLNERTRSSIYA